MYTRILEFLIQVSNSLNIHIKGSQTSTSQNNHDHKTTKKKQKKNLTCCPCLFNLLQFLILLSSFVDCAGDSTPSVEDCVCVSGVNKEVHGDFLPLLFESQEKSGGGKILEVTWNELGDKAVVQFEKQKGRYKFVI